MPCAHLQLREDDVQRVALLALRQPGYSPPRLDISPPITLPRLVPSHGRSRSHTHGTDPVRTFTWA